MAGIDSQIITEFCGNLAGELKSIFPHIDVYFVVYDDGMRANAITRILPGLKDHPAFEKAAALMRFKSAALEHSAFLGIAEGFEHSRLGFKKTPRHLAFFTLNVEEHETEEDLIFTVYRLISQFLDTLSEGGASQGETIDPKASALSNTLVNARKNLRADLFNIFHLVQDGDKEAINQRAQIRALQALNPSGPSRPDEYAFPVALDVTKYAVERFASVARRRETDGSGRLLDAYTLAQNVLKSVDNDSLRTWAQFVGPCQTLAWSGFSPSQILGAAILTSPNPYIKATGHLLVEITHIDPCSEKELPQGYNPFLDDEINLIRHHRNVEETFEMTMIHSMEADSHAPFLRVANNQNEALLKGHISGWCANALQSAARAYEGARSLGVSPQQAARLEFQMCRKNDGWKQLLQLGSHVLELCRNGTEAKTLSGLAKWCGMNPDLKFLKDSLLLTISDPNFTAKLAAVVEMPHVAPLAPATELIRSLSARNDAPAYVPLPEMGLNLGGGGGVSGATPVSNTIMPRKERLEDIQIKIQMED